MSKPAETVRIRVAGRVQGVAFRAWTKRQADELGVSGWVRNEPDGTVSALVSGPPAAVATMCERLRRGPPAARVDTLGVEPVETGASEGGFRILR